MTRSFSQLKTDARIALPGSFCTVFATILIRFILMLGAGSILGRLIGASAGSSSVAADVVSNFLIFVLFTLFQAGQYFIALNIARRGRASISDLFLAFRYEPGTAVLISLVISAIQSLCLFPLHYLLINILFVGTVFGIGSPLMLAGILALGAVISLILEAVIALTYSQAMMLYIDHQDYSALRCLHESRLLMHGKRLRLFLLNLSFAGYYLLAVLSLGIGFIWVVPYRNVTVAEFYMDLTGNYHPY